MSGEDAKAFDNLRRRVRAVERAAGKRAADQMRSRIATALRELDEELAQDAERGVLSR